MGTAKDTAFATGNLQDKFSIQLFRDELFSESLQDEEVFIGEYVYAKAWLPITHTDDSSAIILMLLCKGQQGTPGS